MKKLSNISLKRTPPGTFLGRPISLSDAKEIIADAHDYLKALKNSRPLPKSPVKDLIKLLRSNDIVKKNEDVTNEGLKISLSSIALSDVEVVMIWLASKKQHRRPILTLGKYSLDITKI